MINQAIEEIDRNIKEARKFVERGAALQRLMSNKDFKALIQEGYFEKEAVRLVHLKADASMQTAERQASILKQMDAIGSLSDYFVGIRQQAMLAAKAIEADEETREALAEEGLE